MDLRKTPFENIMGKEENAGNQYFLLYPCFLSIKKICTVLATSTLYNTILTFNDHLRENIVGKGEYAGTQHSLLFQQCFLPFLKQMSRFDLHLICHV